MIGLFLIYSVGKYFYDLATKHNRSPWPYAILGVVTYYGSQFLLGLLLGIILVLTNNIYSEDMEIWVTIGGIAMGAGITYLLYQLLKRNWERKAVVSTKRDDLLDNL